ncbi:hypothetical protein [Streptomyces mirabilis]|uniref:hypothetical protein n=1 Tax=Streptomyces mirabilis TaxID=68239 RepID=UPI0036E27CDC
MTGMTPARTGVAEDTGSAAIENRRPTAYSPEIGLPAVRQGRFPAGWKRDPMT